MAEIPPIILAMAEALVDERPVTWERLLAEGMRPPYSSGRLRSNMLTNDPDADAGAADAAFRPALVWHRPHAGRKMVWTFSDKDGDCVGIDAPETMGAFRLLVKALNVPLPGPESAAPRSAGQDAAQ